MVAIGQEKASRFKLKFSLNYNISDILKRIKRMFNEREREREREIERERERDNL